MSTNTLLRVEGTAWSISPQIESAIKDLKTSKDIVTTLGLDYTVSAHNLMTDVDDPVSGYYGMYRDDTDSFLGIVKSNEPSIVQNVDTFNIFNAFMEEQTITPLVADSYRGGRQFFGCFEFDAPFKVLGDTFKHYFIVINDHLKPDGTVTIINTPVRIACMNALSAALSRSTLKFKLPAYVDPANETVIYNTIQEAYERSMHRMQHMADKLSKIQISRDGIEKLLDELFPYIPEQEFEVTNHSRANQTVDMQRNAFLTCLKSDNIQEHTHNMYGVFNALTDYSQHYHKNGETAFDLERRITILPGVNPEASTESLKVTKFLNNIEKFAAAA